MLLGLLQLLGHPLVEKEGKQNKTRIIYGCFGLEFDLLPDPWAVKRDVCPTQCKNHPQHTLTGEACGNGGGDRGGKQRRYGGGLGSGGGGGGGSNSSSGGTGRNRGGWKNKREKSHLKTTTPSLSSSFRVLYNTPAGLIPKGIPVDAGAGAGARA